MALFYFSLGLEISLTKTKVMIFNKSGKVLKGYKFVLNGNVLHITNEYQYLGIKFSPSGSMMAATDELCSKASRAWFSISNLLYTNKRMPISRALELFDSLVTPVALYASEFWLPCVVQKKCFTSEQHMLKFWETLKCETINQRMCRMLLSLHSKASRLAVLGELGRRPLHVRALQNCLLYKHSLASKSASSLVGLAMAEMASLVQQGKDCWLGRVQKMETLLKVPYVAPYSKGNKITSHIKGRFDRFWLEEIKSVKPGSDGINHNKLRTYSKFKSFFGLEPYLDLVRNRSQRADLTRFRTSAHCLGVERLRYSQPAVPLANRKCRFCGPPGPRVPIGNPGRGPVDDEQHAITECCLMAADRTVLYKEITQINPMFTSLNCQQKFVRLMCPVSPVECKLVSRFISKTFDRRKHIDELGI
jgi:hypothetical protein